MVGSPAWTSESIQVVVHVCEQVRPTGVQCGSDVVPAQRADLPRTASRPRHWILLGYDVTRGSLATGLILHVSLLRLATGAEYCHQLVCLSVCPCVCLSASISLESLDRSSRNSVCGFPVAVARSSSGGVAIYVMYFRLYALRYRGEV